MTSKERNFLRKMAHDLDAVVRVGKEGFNEGIFESIKTYIDKNELMKVKLLQNSLEEVNLDIIREIEENTGAIFVASVGKTMIFFKEKKEKNKFGIITQKFYDFKKSRSGKNV